MVTRNIEDADPLCFINTNLPNPITVDEFYIETMIYKQDERYLSVHGSNPKDHRDGASRHVHFRSNDHKATKWKISNLKNV